jgi:carbon monoxide dehydrogenase subunit G
VTEGEDRHLASLVRQENLIELTPAPGGGTELSYRTEFTVTGRLGKLGLTILGARARKVAEEFVQSLKARIESPSATTLPIQEAKP